MPEVISVNDSQVAIFLDPNCTYNTISPFQPLCHYPEYPFESASIEAGLATQARDGYHAVRETLHLLGYDSVHFGTIQWNPLGHIIHPGSDVVVKPNFVLHVNESGLGLVGVVTHPSILRAVIDYCYIAMRGKGRVTIADAPQMDCDFEELRRSIGLDSLISFYDRFKEFEVSLLDLRKLRCKRDFARELYPAQSFVSNEHADPKGYVICDLGKNSRLEGLEGIDNLYGADYDRKFTAENHKPGRHRYCISRTILEADAVICIPKMKTHKKVGVTLGMKLLVGINGDKNHLAHFRVGDPTSCGDEFPAPSAQSVWLQRKILRFVQDRILTRRRPAADVLWSILRSCGVSVGRSMRRARLLKSATDSDRIFGGNWYGNDTAWRMAADLARIFIYADNNGRVRSEPQRNTLFLVDGIVAGEGEGPMSPMPKKIGVMVGGANILAVDTAATTLMGFDYRKIMMIYDSWNLGPYPLARFPANATYVFSNEPELEGKNVVSCRRFVFEPNKYWKGHIEVD